MSATMPLKREQTARSPRRIQTVTSIVLVVVIASWQAATMAFPLAETRVMDVSVLALVALSFTLFWAVRTPHKTSSSRSELVALVILISAAIWLIAAALLSTLNAILDRNPSQVFRTVVVNEGCYRLVCDWTLRGAPTLPVNAKTMKVERWARSGEPAFGDTVILSVKPGFFGRPWISRKIVRRFDLRFGLPR